MKVRSRSDHVVSHFRHWASGGARSEAQQGRWRHSVRPPQFPVQTANHELNLCVVIPSWQVSGSTSTLNTGLSDYLTHFDHNFSLLMSEVL